MAKFLNTSATNYFLEELIKQAKERVILISPFLKLNDRVKELLEDKADFLVADLSQFFIRKMTDLGSIQMIVS